MVAPHFPLTAPQAWYDHYAALDLPGLECSPGTLALHDDGYGRKFADLAAFMSMDNMHPEVGKEFEAIMKGYHDLVDHGRREIYKIEN